MSNDFKKASTNLLIGVLLFVIFFIALSMGVAVCAAIFVHFVPPKTEEGAKLIGETFGEFSFPFVGVLSFVLAVLATKRRWFIKAKNRSNSGDDV